MGKGRSTQSTNSWAGANSSPEASALYPGHQEVSFIGAKYISGFPTHICRESSRQASGRPLVLSVRPLVTNL